MRAVAGLEPIRGSLTKRARLAELAEQRFRSPQDALDCAFEAANLGVRGAHPLYRRAASYFLHGYHESSTSRNEEGRRRDALVAYTDDPSSASRGGAGSLATASRGAARFLPRLQDWCSLFVALNRAGVQDSELTQFFREAIFLAGMGDRSDADAGQHTSRVCRWEHYRAGAAGASRSVVFGGGEERCRPELVYDAEQLTTIARYYSLVGEDAEFFEVLAARLKTAPGLTSFAISSVAKSFSRVGVRSSRIQELVLDQLPRMLAADAYSGMDLSHICSFLLEQGWDGGGEGDHVEERQRTLQEGTATTTFEVDVEERSVHMDVADGNDDTTVLAAHARHSETFGAFGSGIRGGEALSKFLKGPQVPEHSSSSSTPSGSAHNDEDSNAKLAAKRAEMLSLLGTCCESRLPTLGSDELATVLLLFAKARLHWDTIVNPGLKRATRLPLTSNRTCLKLLETASLVRHTHLGFWHHCARCMLANNVKWLSARNEDAVAQPTTQNGSGKRTLADLLRRFNLNLAVSDPQKELRKRAAAQHEEMPSSSSKTSRSGEDQHPPEDTALRRNEILVTLRLLARAKMRSASLVESLVLRFFLDGQGASGNKAKVITFFEAMTLLQVLRKLEVEEIRAAVVEQLEGLNFGCPNKMQLFRAERDRAAGQDGA